MSLKNINPTETVAWKNLSNHFEELKKTSIINLFESDDKRVEKFTIQWDQFLIDYSKNKINQKTISLLLDLASEIGLQEAITSYFAGEKINKTENRAVLHTALRSVKTEKIIIEGENIIVAIQAAKLKIRKFSDEIISGTKKGFTNKNFTDIVNIGVGGSDLGPAMVVDSLQFYKNHLNSHFISNIDGDHVKEIIKKLNPETTLFIIVSKSFTTQETLVNAETIKNWFLEKGTFTDIEKHFVAITANQQKAINFGVNTKNIFPMWNWVGGRFSLWSPVGLSINLAIGNTHFESLLDGARKMDTHFKTERFDKNIPVLLALLSIWYNNFFGSESEAIIPYTQYLQKLTPYLQQAIMESNGKSVDRNGNKIKYQTGTIVWGEPGTNSQHAFFQLIHQGTKLIPTDFIGFIKPLHGNKKHHDKLMSNFFAQTEALLKGKTSSQVENEFKKNNDLDENKKFVTPFKEFSGNKPTNTILIDSLTPENLGSLIAMYEHKIFVQGIIWNIFSYDQWGVELGKQLANSILEDINNKKIQNHDKSTQFLLDYYINKSS